jgi:HEAT repeat protein
MSPRDAPDAVFSMAFSDADARVRVEIVRALAVRGPAERADRLLAAAEDRDERVRKAAVVALGRVATPESRAVLLRSLADADGDVVRAAGGSLAHTLKEMPPELVAAASSERAIVRIASSQALAALGAKESLSALRKLSADPVDEVRREAIRGLGTLGEPHAAAAKGELERIAASGARSRTDRFEAIQSLAEGPLTPDAEILVRVTRDDEDPLLRVAAARTLVGRGDVRGIPVLVALVEPATQDGQPVGDDEARALAVSAASETLRAVAGAVPQSGEPTAWTSALPQLQAIVARPGFEYVPSRLAEPR